MPGRGREGNGDAGSRWRTGGPPGHVHLDGMGLLCGSEEAS
jgi:hypothetical protein